ncbi:MAG: hypothetical protein ABSD98_19425 [Candidatus Korobacteraceae bacterium]|jgi:hypothetical protein
MPFTKHSAASGKKQAPMPGPNSAAYKKLLAAGKGAAAKTASGNTAAKTSASQPGAQSPRPSTAFSSLKSRQRVVERVNRAIWASVLKINEAIIKLALAGNYNAAKALFDFAGVYTLPTSDDNNSSAASASAAAPAPADAAPANPIESFFRSIGVAPPCDEPEPDIALQSL